VEDLVVGLAALADSQRVRRQVGLGAVGLVQRDADHEHHETTFEALAHRRLGLSGHAAFETFSVVTRLPT